MPQPRAFAAKVGGWGVDDLTPYIYMTTVCIIIFLLLFKYTAPQPPFFGVLL